KISAGQVRDEYISTIDFPVTILDAAGTKFTQNEVHGKSILPLVTGEDVSWREDIMSETHGHGYGEDIIGRMIVHDGYKYVATKDHLHELYNLKDDPYELKNLFDDPASAEKLRDMQARLLKWQKATNDPEKVI